MDRTRRGDVLLRALAGEGGAGRGGDDELVSTYAGLRCLGARRSLRAEGQRRDESERCRGEGWRKTEACAY